MLAQNWLLVYALCAAALCRGDSTIDINVVHRRAIENLLKRRPVFISAGSTGVQNQTVNQVFSLVKEIDDVVTENMRHIADEIRGHYINNHTAHVNRQHIEAITGHASSLTPSSLANELLHVSIALQAPISPEYLLNITEQQQFIDALQTISTTSFALDANRWVQPLAEVADQLANTELWHSFLTEIHANHSQLDFRKDLKRFNVSNLDDWGVADRPQGLPRITNDNFQAFAMKLQSSAALLKYQPTDSELDVLNRLLDITVRQAARVSCDTDSTRLVVSGDYVRLSDVDLNACGDIDKLKVLNVFALHTVIVDKGLDAVGREWQVSIIAPRWVVDGEQHIGLSGSDAAAVGGEAAANSTGSKAGDDGVPGAPGGNAGHFLGIGREFVNGDKLKVTADGGRGGGAQSGGTGSVGKKVEGIKDFPTGSSNGKYELDQKGLRLVTQINSSCTNDYALICNTYWFIAYECGSSGGKGGHGGLGGNGGIVRLFDLNTTASIAFSSETGAAGVDGKGGAAGSIAPKQQALYQAVTQFMPPPQPPLPTAYIWFYIGEETDDTCPPIFTATDGGNVEGQKSPPPTTFDVPAALIEYEAFARENQADQFRREHLTAFIELIHGDERILGNYTTLAFIRELKTLERQFFALKNNIDLAPYYRSVAQRIEAFVNAKNHTEVDQQTRKVFNYLYTAAWGKYLALNVSIEPNLVIDIIKYLDVTVETIAKLDETSRQIIIERDRKTYSDGIEKKIEDAGHFIDEDILPGIQNASKALNGEIYNLTTEVVKMMNDTAKDEKDYHDKQERLEKLMVFRVFFGVANTLGQCASVLGPVGAAVGTVASSVSQVGLAFTDDTTPVVDRIKKLPDAVKATLELYQLQRKKEAEAQLKILDEQLKKFTNEGKTETESGAGSTLMTDTLAKMVPLQAKIDEITGQAGKIDPVEFEKLQMDLVKLIDVKDKIKQKDKMEANEKKAVETLERWGKYVQLSQNVLDLSESLGTDADKVIAAGKAFADKSDLMDQLREYRMSINAVMLPLIDEMRNKIKEMESQVEGQSGVALDVSKWRIQSFISDAKFKLRSLTKDYKTQDSLMHTVDKLDDAFAMLIKVYDRIDAYRDQTKLADFIAHIGSAAVSNIDVTDDQLRTDLLQLNLQIEANVLLAQYTAATDAFKQSVFPFITYYLTDYDLPANLQLGKDTASLVQVASTQLSNLRSKLVEYNQASINGNRKFIVTDDFDSRYASSRSFYQWTPQQEGYAIAELLAGRPVTLRADIHNATQRNAVKFQRVELIVRTDDPVLQPELDKLLVHLDVQLTHLGDSSYRCGANYYVINSASQEIYYSFERRADDVPVRKNGVYEQLMNNEFMLSPYTMWSVQLFEANKGSGGFDGLAVYADRVKVELVGKGQYVRDTVPVCTAELNRYYQLDTSISRIADVVQAKTAVLALDGLV